MTEDKSKRESFNDYPGALAALARKIRSREFDPDEYYIVLTPDRYTQTVESALFSDGGALDCEVLTLSRLARRIAPDDKTLSLEGGIMLVSRAVDRVRDKLEYYGKASAYCDFARDAYDTLGQFRSSGVDICALDISGSSSVDAKLRDLQLIMREYTLIKKDFSDSSDRLVRLAAAVRESELIRKSHVYAIGYEFGYAATALNRAVFEAVRKHAREFTEYKVEPTQEPRERITVFSAPDKVTQYKEIAARIKDYLYNGGAPDDVYVVCPEPRALARILGEYGIAFYHDESVPLECTPPLAALDCIYKLVTSVGGAAESKTLIALCKNPFSGVDDTDAQRLQLAIGRKRFFRLDDKIKLDEPSRRAADRAIELMSYFKGGMGEAVKNVVVRAEFESVYRRLYGDDTDGITPITELAELVERYGSGEREADAKAFFSAAHSVTIKSLPRFKNRVTVTVPQTLRMTACKKLFIADFNEGVIPTASSDDGLMSDDELYYVNNGVCKAQNVEPTVREQNRRERQELMSVVKNAGDVFCTYVESGRMKLSAFASELARSVERLSFAEQSNALLLSDDPEYIALYACTPAAAREIVARKASKHYRSVGAAVGDCDFRAAPFERTVTVSPRKRVSVTELKNWFACPYKRFLSDVTGVNERRDGVLAAPDFGIVVHEFMRRFLSAPPYDCSLDNVKALVSAILEEKEIEPDEHAFERLTNDAKEFAELNVHILETGKYAPVGFEKDFGGVALGNEYKLEFVGVIDRLDECNGRYRIMDYKTGSTEFEIRNCVLGTDMQLPLYAYAAGGDVTGFFYVKLGSRFDNKDKPLHGTFVRDIDVVAEYDINSGDFCPSDILSVKLKLDKKTGEVAFDGRYKGGMSRAGFEALIDYCVRAASRAVDEMASGYIDRTPVENKCGYCAYRGICGDNVAARSTDVDCDFEDGEADDE